MPRLLATHAARSRNLAEGGKNRSVAKWARLGSGETTDERARGASELRTRNAYGEGRRELVTEGLESGESLEGPRRLCRGGSEICV